MRKTISLSKHLGISRDQLEEVGVFDATLGIDTKLFVDPKLLVDSDIPEFKDSRTKILRYFARLLRIHKQSAKSPRLQEEARNMLAISEPRGLSIGYGNKSDRGTAIAKTLADRILLSASEIMAVGIEDEELVELLGLFVKGFGPDSISDLVVSIIYPDFCAYTQRVAAEFGVLTKEHQVEGKRYRLPQHPFKNTPVIFVPHSLMSPLPVAVSWDDIAAAAQHNKELRDEFNEIVFPTLQKTLNDIKNRTSEEISEFKKEFEHLLNIYKRVEAKPYDLQSDQRGYYALQPFVENEAKIIKPTPKPKTHEELIKSLRELITQFQRAIEDNGGNTLLYRKSKTGKIQKNSPHNEDVAQILFYLIADFYCQRADILLSRESNAGRGPVDFSLGTGYSSKILVEIKKSTNHDLENGYKKQIKAYEKGEKAFYSFFVVIVVKEVNKKIGEYTSQLQNIKKLFDDNIAKGIPTPELKIIDGLIHPSPSKLN